MATTSAIATQHQCSAGTVWTPPPVVGVEATLVTAHRFLNNPPLVHVSPSAAEQWCHDVDQLIIAAINTPYHEGGVAGVGGSAFALPLSYTRTAM
jgi:hypothetical protein